MAEAVLLVAVCGVAFAAGVCAPLVPGLAATGALFAGLLPWGDSPIPFVLVTAGPWCVGRLVRSRRQVVQELEHRTRELGAERDAYADLAVRRERARIATELHDIVAHHLAVVVVQAGAGRVAPGEAATRAERLETIRRAGDQALVEMERLVALLQSGLSEDEPGEVQELLDQAQAAGLDLDADRMPAEHGLPSEVERAAYRVLREGLTNAMKHAPGSEVTVRLDLRADVLQVEVRDRGGSADPELSGTGSAVGLAGMRERVEQLGGSLDAGPDGAGGWRLLARLPTG